MYLMKHQQQCFPMQFFKSITEPYIQRIIHDPIGQVTTSRYSLNIINDRFVNVNVSNRLEISKGVFILALQALEVRDLKSLLELRSRSVLAQITLIDKNCHPLLENTLQNMKTGSKFRSNPKDIAFSISLISNFWNFVSQNFCSYNVNMY